MVVLKHGHGSRLGIRLCLPVWFTMRARFVLICILLLISGTAYAGDIKELSLADAVEIAQKNAQVWTQYDAKMESAIAQKKVAQSHWWPILTLSSTFMLWSDESKIEVIDKEKLRAAMDQSVDNAMNSLGISEEGQKLLHEIVEPLRPTINSFVQPISDQIPSSITLKDDLTFTFGATLTMPITPLFKVYQAQELAQVGIDNVDAERRGKALAVQFEVTQVYLKLVYAQLMCDVAEEALATIEAHVALAQKYESVGMISHNDVLTAQVEQLKAKQNVVEAKNSTRLAGMKLAQVLSMERGTEVRALNMPRETFDIQMESLESYQERALKQRTELERIGLGQEAAERKQKMALLDYVPQIVLIGHYQYGYGLDILKPRNQAFVGLGMTWNVFDGLGHYYESKMASLEKDEMVSKGEEARALIELEVGQKYLALQTATERLELTQQAVILAEENLRTITAKFEQGESVSTDVLTAETRHAAARADEVKAHIDILIAYAELLLSIGESPTIDETALR